ncbi:hypothetical protein M8C21_006767 [Ambrosia artemisiifolia]|uniref:Uncharacterized protein n=1 Tax=Ambrosia artemisiifolia TaxID=4212 RepID=A0AAD5D0L8_AMBAR|nr:hypothetical protein M8C21_006767 [Ambrosia artemisiifolia]
MTMAMDFVREIGGSELLGPPRFRQDSDRDLMMVDGERRLLVMIQMTVSGGGDRRQQLQFCAEFMTVDGFLESIL